MKYRLSVLLAFIVLLPACALTTSNNSKIMTPAAFVENGAKDVPPFLKALALLKIGDKQGARTIAQECSARNYQKWYYCELVMGLVSKSFDESIAHFSSAEGGVSQAYLRVAHGEYDKDLPEIAPMKPGEFERIAYAILKGHYGVAIYNSSADCQRALPMLMEYEALRGGDHQSYDGPAEVLAFCLQDNKEYDKAATYLQGFIETNNVKPGKEYCGVSYNISAFYAAKNDVLRSIKAAKVHLDKCSAIDFLKEVSGDSDFSIIRSNPDFKKFIDGVGVGK